MYADIINQTSARAGMTTEELFEFYESRDPGYASELRALYQAGGQEETPEQNQGDGSTQLRKERRGMKNPLKEKSNKLLQELEDIGEVLDSQSKNDAERRYREVVAALLGLITDVLCIDHTLLLVLLGLVIGHMLSRIF